MAHIDARPRCVAAVRSMGRKRERESGGDGGGERETRDDAQPAAQKPRRAERSIGEQTSHIKNKQRRGAIYERLKHKAAVRPDTTLHALRCVRCAPHAHCAARVPGCCVLRLLRLGACESMPALRERRRQTVR